MNFSRIFGAAAAIILTVAQLSAQGGGRGTSPGAAASPTGSPGNIGGNTTPNGKSNSPGNFPGDAPRAMLINGKVTIDDGSSPGEPVRIERVCSGRARPEGYTDTKGRFQFTLGQEQDVLADASETAGRSTNLSNPNAGVRESQLIGCDLRGVLPGFRSDTVSLANHRYLDNPDVGTIVLHRLANVEGFTTSATSSLAPKDARKAFEKGLEAEKKSKPDDAQKDFEKAVEVYPKYASAWFELGKIYEQHDQFDQARDAYNKAMTADSKYINPYERLYVMALNDHKWEEAANLTDRVIHLNPYDFPMAFYYNAIANLELNKLDIAEKNAREAVKLDTQKLNPRSNYILGIVLAQKQDFPAAAECLRTYLKERPDSKEADAVRKQLGEIEKASQAKAQPQP
jgi:tetratricopeptide (TPR) repeat protein